MKFFAGFMMGMILLMLIVKFIVKPYVEELQSQAVAHGAAEWVVDQKTGNTSFRWKGGSK